VPPSTAILVRGARQLLTLRGNRPRRGPEMNDLGIIRDGALLIRDGVIDRVGVSRQIENLAGARDAVEINAAGRIVMPGFVDSHTHLLFPPPGITADDGRDAAHAIAAATAQRLAGRVQNYVQAMARHGSTTVEVKAGCGADEAAALKLLRVAADLQGRTLDLVPTLLFRLPPSDDAGSEAEAARRVIAELLPKIHRRRLARFADVAWDAGSGRHLHFTRYMGAAQQHELGLKVHADQATPRGAIILAVERFAASVDHLEHADADDARLLRGIETVATLLPAASFHSGGPFAPARALIDAGAAVALATNFNPHLTPTLSMQTVLSLARKCMKMTAAEAIAAATINGASALGCGARVGSLENGKQADLVVVNAGDYREVAEQMGTNLVQVTIRRGEILYREGVVMDQR
jgi:imidazolonepropionase